LELPFCFLSQKKNNTSPTQAKKNVTRIAPAKIIAALSKPRVAAYFRLSRACPERKRKVDCEVHFRREELRVICGTRGNPDTVAPFRAWRGSRDLVAQSPKFHAPAAAHFAPLLV
jgi:hypothetical protein